MSNSSPSQNSNATHEHYYEHTFLLNHSIERIWYIVRDISLLSMLTNNNQFPLIIKDCKTSWTIGAEFQGKSTIYGDFEGKCTKVNNFPQMKKIAWLIRTKNFPSLQTKIQLYKVSEGDSSVLFIKIKGDKSPIPSNFKIEKYEECLNKLIQKIDKILTQSSLNLFQYESSVISASLNDIWEFLGSIGKLKKIAPCIRMDSSNVDWATCSKKGDVRKITYDNQKEYYFAKTLIYNKKENWNKWLFSYEAYGGEPKIPTQRVYVTLSKINNQDCHLGIFHGFKEPTSQEQIKELSNMKKYIICSIKDFLENYKAN